MNNINPTIAGFIKPFTEPLFRSDEQIIEEMKDHNKAALSRSRKMGKKGQTIFSLKHYVTIDKEAQNTKP